MERDQTRTATNRPHLLPHAAAMLLLKYLDKLLLLLLMVVSLRRSEIPPRHGTARTYYCEIYLRHQLP